MIVPAACFTCEGPPQVFQIRATTKRWVLTKCAQGHTVGIIFQAAGWARLFERGLQRLVLGETRDAILDAYTAFEMYLAEVPVRARYDREPGAKPSTLREQLKPAVSRAENAIGAARAAASLASGKPAITWKEAITTTVRNNAIHSGAYPTEADAEKLCIEVGRVILEFEAALDSISCQNPGPYHAAAWAEEATEFKTSHPDVKPSYVSDGAIFDWTHSIESRPTVVAQLATYRDLAARGVLR